MDCKDRIMAVFNHEIPDRVPIMELDMNSKIIAQHYGDDYGSVVEIAKLKWMEKIPGWRYIMKGTMANPKTYINMVLKAIKLYRKMGLDAVCAPICLFPVKNLDRKKKIGGKPAIKFTIPNWAMYVDEYGRLFKTIPTTYGFEILYYIDGALTSEQLFDEWGPISETADLPMRMEIYEAALKEAKNPDGSYSIFPIPSIGGLNEVTWEALGMKFFAKSIRRNRPFIRRVLDDRKKFSIDLIKNLADRGAELVICYDDLGFKEGPLIRPDDFRELFVPRMKEMVDVAHKRGMKFFLHSCGNLNELWDDLISTGIDGLHPIEPTAKMDIFALKKKNPNLVFIGNVSPQDLQDKTPDFIRDYTTRLMTECKPGGHYILSSGHSINPAVDLQNYLAMREIHAKYAQY